MANQLDNARILIVDDEQSIREGSARILSRMGCQVLTASRGEEGLAVLEKEPITIILLDMKMPGMDGMEVLKEVTLKYPDILVIVITGYATVETAIEAMKKGAYDFIPKPFEPDQLRIVVNRAHEKQLLTLEAKKSESARKRTLMDLDAEKSRVRTIIESLPNGVLVTNARGRVVLMNPTCREYLKLPPDKETGLPVEEYISDKGLCNLIMEISEGCHVDYNDIPTYEFATSGETYLLARARPVLGEKKECLGTVVTLADVTTMKVIDRLKSEFVAKVTHELRSPLSTIHEQLALVMNDMVGEMPQNEAHLLSRAKEKTQGLISLIGDLLDLSRIESGSACHEAKTIQADELLQGIVDFLGTRAKTKNQSLTLHVLDKNLPPLTLDPIALESIFGNLISNAINYTPEGGEIKVIVDRAGVNLRVRVQDNGFGIEAKYLEKIFERFYRVKNEKTRYITGTGLGLPIVKGLVDSMKGVIEVESEPGRGTTFTVLLPITVNK
jgi:two-component system, OmpR family, phosphate regulon sensor histidine kinase PhoR